MSSNEDLRIICRSHSVGEVWVSFRAKRPRSDEATTHLLLLGLQIKSGA